MTLTPLAAWILTFLLHSTVLTGLALLCVRFMDGPAGKALVLRGALLGAFVTATLAGFAGSGQEWMLPEVKSSGAVISVQASAQPGGMEVAPATAAAANAATVQPGTGGPSLGDLAWTWVPVSLVLLSVIGALRLVLRERAAWRLLGKRKRITDSAITKMARSLPGGNELGRSLRLTQSVKTRTPMAIGRREIVLPEKAVAELDPAQLEALLAHEMGHLVRRDPIWLGACRLAVALAWFQPLLRWTMVHLEEETELAADDWAAQRVGNGVDLALCLERVGTWLSEAPTPTSAAAMASSGSALVSRVERLLSDGKPESRRSLLVVSGAVVVGLGVFSCVGPSVTAGENQRGQNHRDNGGDPLMATNVEPKGDALFATRAENSSDIGSGENNNGEFIRVWVYASGPDQAPSYRTADGSFQGVAELRKWLDGQIKGDATKGIRFHLANGMGHDDTRPAIETAIAAGFTDISFGGEPSNQHEEWIKNYNDEAKQQLQGKAMAARNLPPLAMEVRLNGSGKLTSFRSVAPGPNQPIGIKSDDPRLEMLNAAHEEDPMSVYTVLEVPMDALIIRVEADTPFGYVQKIMEKCASQEIQLADIHVRLNGDPDFLTDISLPVDAGIVPEEIEESEMEEATALELQAEDAPIDRLPNLVLGSDSEVLGTIKAEMVEAQFSKQQMELIFKNVISRDGQSHMDLPMFRLSQRFPRAEEVLEISKIRVQNAIITCDSSVAMGSLLPLLNSWTKRGTKLAFKASIPQTR